MTNRVANLSKKNYRISQRKSTFLAEVVEQLVRFSEFVEHQVKIREKIQICKIIKTSHSSTLRLEQKCVDVHICRFS